MAFQGDSIYWVEVEKVVPNPFQPRREFDQNKLQELADSIRMYGVLQPLTVTRKEVQQENGTFYTEYELIAGERRLRASKLAGVAQVPVIIREGEQSEQEKLELAIIENLQREDLNAVDRAIAFRQLADVFGLSHAQVAQKVGRSREYVSNSIRLLALPEHILESLKHTNLTEGHARTLLMLSDRPEEQEVIFREILLKKLSVREVERIVRKIATDKVRKKNPGEFDASLIEFEKQFTETLGTRVQIQKTDFGGKLTIDYFSEDDLQAILKRVTEEVTLPPLNQPDMIERLTEHTPLMVEPETVPTVSPTLVPQPTSTSTPVPEAPIEQSFVSVHHPVPEPVQESDNLPILIVEKLPEVSQVPSGEVVIPVQEPPVPNDIVTTKSEETPHIAPRDIDKTVQKDEPIQPIATSPSFSPMITPVSEIVPPQIQTPATNEDESGLYSIRNFSV